MIHAYHTYICIAPNAWVPEISRDFWLRKVVAFESCQYPEALLTAAPDRHSAQELVHSKKPNRGTLKPCRSTIEQMRVMEGRLGWAVWQQWQRHKPGDTSDTLGTLFLKAFAVFATLETTWGCSIAIKGTTLCDSICVFFTHFGLSRSIQHRHSNTLGWCRGTKDDFFAVNFRHDLRRCRKWRNYLIGASARY